MPLTAAEKKLAAAIGFDEDVCEIVKEQTDRALDRLTAFTEEYEPEDPTACPSHLTASTLSV